MSRSTARRVGEIVSRLGGGPPDRRSDDLIAIRRGGLRWPPRWDRPGAGSGGSLRGDGECAPRPHSTAGRVERQARTRSEKERWLSCRVACRRLHQQAQCQRTVGHILQQHQRFDRAVERGHCREDAQRALHQVADGQTALAQLPQHIGVHPCIVHADPPLPPVRPRCSVGNLPMLPSLYAIRQILHLRPTKRLIIGLPVCIMPLHS